MSRHEQAISLQALAELAAGERHRGGRRARVEGARQVAIYGQPEELARLTAAAERAALTVSELVTVAVERDIGPTR